MAFYNTFHEMMHNTTQSWKYKHLDTPFQFIRIIPNNNPEMIDKTNYALELAKQQSNVFLFKLISLPRFLIFCT